MVKIAIYEKLFFGHSKASVCQTRPNWTDSLVWLNLSESTLSLDIKFGEKIFFDRAMGAPLKIFLEKRNMPDQRQKAKVKANPHQIVKSISQTMMSQLLIKYESSQMSNRLVQNKDFDMYEKKVESSSKSNVDRV